MLSLPTQAFSEVLAAALWHGWDVGRGPVAGLDQAGLKKATLPPHSANACHALWGSALELESWLGLGLHEVSL